MAGVWTGHQFDQSADLLVKALRKCQHEGADERARNTLLEWELIGADGRNGAQVSYLAHRVVHRSISGGNSASDTANHAAQSPIIANGDDDIDEYDYVDETIWDDPDCESLPRHDDHRQQHATSTEWRFNVVYNETWRVPVLYFHAQDANGSPLTRSQVLEALHCSSDSSSQNLGIDNGKDSSNNGHDADDVHNYHQYHSIPRDTWEFISEDMHPVTGVPTMFLHPCQTTARMVQLMTTTATKSKDAIIGIAEDIDETAAAALDETTQKTLELWTWMSLVVPAVGYRVPPRVFQDVRTRIRELSADAP